MKDSVDYMIISKPDYIYFECPYCKNEVEVGWNYVDYKTEYWGDGAYCDCPICNKEVELGDYEYE